MPTLQNASELVLLAFGSEGDHGLCGWPSQKYNRRQSHWPLLQVRTGRSRIDSDTWGLDLGLFWQVDNVDIKRLPDGTSRGFAFVKFVDRESVDKVAVPIFAPTRTEPGIPYRL